MITLDSKLTTNEQEFLRQLIRVTPAPYLNTPDSEKIRNFKLLGVAAQALSDYNGFPPEESFTFASLPQQIFDLIIFGTQWYMQVYKQMEFSLVDLAYNSQGLSITLDRVGKIDVPLKNAEKIWLDRIQRRKNIVLLHNGGVGLSTPRFSSSLSRAVIALSQGSAFGWQIP